MFTELHLNLAIYHPAMGCSYVQCKSSSTGKPSIQNYHCVTRTQVAFGCYQVRVVLKENQFSYSCVTPVTNPESSYAILA